MPEIINSFRQKTTWVLPEGRDRLRSRVSYWDSSLEASLELIVRTPALEISSVSGKILLRGTLREVPDIDKILSTILNLRIGPGIKKQLLERFKEVQYGKVLRSMVEEAINGVILSFTKKVLQNAPKDPEGERLHFQEMVRNNPRLLNSCAALSEGSPIMEGFRLDESRG